MKTQSHPTHVDMWANSHIASLDVEMRGEATIDIEAAGDGPKKPARFSMIAYTGKPMRPMTNPPLKYPVIVDLAGTEAVTRSLPALMDHDSKQRVGHTERVSVESHTLKASGFVSGTGPAAVEVQANAANGFPWQVSMGAALSKLEFVPEGRTVQVNGRDASGPVYVARASRIRELSFLTLAADDDTAAQINAAASAATKGSTMDFVTWLQAKGFGPADKLSETQLVVLKAAHKADQDAEPNPADKGGTTAVAAGTGVTAEQFTAMTARLDQVAKASRDGEIRVKCAAHTEIAAKAIKNGWDDEAIDAAIKAADLTAALSRQRSTFGINTGVKNDKVDAGVALEAAVCMSAGMVSIDKAYDADTLTAAREGFRNGIGLQELLLDAAAQRGYRGRGRISGGNLREVMLAAFGPVEMSAASGFSTLSLPGIFSNVANKFLLTAFNSVESSWKDICTMRSATDFKTITSYRLNGDLKYDELPPDGEIKHGTLSEESYTNKVKTYAKMAAITRQDIINDDLGALTDIPKRLGRGAALKMNEVFWKEFLANSGFFTSGNKNLATGAALSIDGLTTTSTKFLDQVDADKNPLAITPEILLVPNALAVLARTLMASTNVFDTTANSKNPTVNPHAGLYKVVRSAYLSNASLTGNSTTAYYLLANPGDLATIEVVLLDGRTEPVIETADADFDTLGVQMRGYHDWGVAKQDPRAGVKGTP